MSNPPFDRINELISEGHDLLVLCPSPENKGYTPRIDILLEAKCTEWISSSLNFLRYFFGYDHLFTKMFSGYATKQYMFTERDSGGSSFQTEVIYYKEKMAKLVGILRSVKREVELGYIEDSIFLHKKESLSNILGDGFTLLKHGYKEAAAIYGRIVLETTVKELCKLKEIEVEKNEKFPSVLVKLRKKGTIDLPLERSLQAQYDIGSLAAHGKKEFDEKTPQDILFMLTFIRDSVLQLK